MQSSTLFANQMLQRHQSGQLEAAVQKVLRRILRSGEREASGLKKLVVEKFQQLKEPESPVTSAKEADLIDGISRTVSARIASKEGQAELRSNRRRGAETLNFGSSKLTNLLDSLDLGRHRNPGSQPAA